MMTRAIFDCRRGRERLTLASLLLAVAMAVPAFGADEARPQVRILAGTVQGSFDASSKVVAYKGIPYAKPPTGELRWRRAARDWR